jgi:GTP cyclohydrolase I
MEAQNLERAATAIRDLLAALGVDEGEHTSGTPERVARAWDDMLWGYHSDPDDHLSTTFPAPFDPGLIVQAGIDVQSICAHHLLPFGGWATVAYRPFQGQPVVGLSKLTRLVYGYSARAQIQERIGQQVASAMDDKLTPEGVMVIISASHDCIRLRGARSPASLTTTVAQRGALTGADVALVQQMHSRSHG